MTTFYKVIKIQRVEVLACLLIVLYKQAHVSVLKMKMTISTMVLQCYKGLSGHH